jgi:hypothetical protein
MNQGFLPLYHAARGGDYIDYLQVIAHTTSEVFNIQGRR